MAEEIRKREEIDAKYKWDLTHIYSSDETWKADFDRVQTKIEEMGAALNGTVAENPKRAVRAYFDLQKEILPVFE